MRREIYKILLAAFTMLLFGFNANAQLNPHPCTLNGVACDDEASRDGMIYSFTEDTLFYPAVGTSMPFWIAVGDPVTRTIDTTVVSPVAATLLSGPGSVQGGLAVNLAKYVYFNDWIFNESGVYKFEINVPGLVTDTILIKVVEPVDLCAEAPNGCGNGGGDIVFPLAGNGGIIPVDAIFPITMGILDESTGILDTSFNNYGYLNQLSGPGNMYGTFSMYGAKWLTFTDVRFDAVGEYEVELTTNGIHRPDTINVTVIQDNSVRGIDVELLSVYPNPFNDKITIDLKAGDKIEFAYIFNSQGQLLNSFNQPQSTTFDVADLPSGVYFLEIQLSGTLSTQKGILVKK